MLFMNGSIESSNFSERLKELLFYHELTAKQLSVIIGISRATAYRWTKKPLQIKRKNLIAIADYFSCTIEFLIGRSNDDTKIKPKKCPDLTSQVKKIMNEQNISTYQFEKTSKFKCSYFNAWNKGYEPSVQILIDLADFFGCTIDYLVGRE